MRTSARHITEQNPKPPQGLTAQALTHRHRPAWPPQARDQRLSVCESRFCWPFADPRQRPSAHGRTSLHRPHPPSAREQQASGEPKKLPSAREQQPAGEPKKLQ